MTELNAAGRRALPKSDFALPGKGAGPEGKGAGAYPIDTEGRARSALSRGAANASPSEQATIRAKVHAKYPGMEIGHHPDRPHAHHPGKGAAHHPGNGTTHDYAGSGSAFE